MKKIPSAKKLYEEKKDTGASENELAKKYNTTRSVIHGRIYRYKKEFLSRSFDGTSFNYNEGTDSHLMVGDEVGNNLVIHVNKNTGQVFCRSRSIKTLDSLIEAANIDLDKWEITKHVINKWDVTTSEAITYENWQVKAWLARREPIEIMPDIQPMVVPLSHLEAPRQKNKRNRCKDMPYRVMAIFDPHFGFDKDPRTQELIPYHNNDILQLALDIYAHNNFNAIVFGGDILDCNEWSNHFIQRPEFRQTTQPALFEASKWLGSFVKTKPNNDVIVLRGNHDDRIERYIISNLAEIYKLVPGDNPESEPLMSFSNLLGLKRMGIKYQDKFVYGDTKIVHGDIARKGGGSTARAHLDNKAINIVFGHVHRRELVTERKSTENDKIKNIFSMCPGCVCYTDGRVPGSKETDNWQNGIGVLTFLKNKCIGHEIIKIDNNKTFYNDKLYSK